MSDIARVVTFQPTPRRTDLFVTTAQQETPALWARATALAQELNCPTLHRRNGAMKILFDQQPTATRAVIVQKERLLLADNAGHSMFHHPSMGYLRFGQLLMGGHDMLVEATQIKPGDSLLDCTLGFASEAALCAHIIGDTGEVHGVEAVPELGVIVRDGLQTVVTERPTLNEAMRRVKVVYLGPNIEYLRTCPDNRYDVVYFDPFFEQVLSESEHIAPLRLFGDHSPLTPETLTEAVRVARRRVVVKATRWSETWARLGITEILQSKNGKVAYGIVNVGP